MDEFLTVAEVAELLKVNPQTVRNWIDRDELPAVRVGQRRVRVRRADLDQFLESGATAGVPLGEQAQAAFSLILPAAIRGGLAEAELPGPWSDWETLMTGGDLGSGVFRNLDLCPCHQCYSVNSNVIPLAAVPKAAQVPALLAYPPDPPPEDRLS